jgi:hypothetical protein
MKDIRGREQTGYAVQDRKTGKIYRTYETYAKRLVREGKMKILAQEGEKDYNKYMVQDGDGGKK